MFGQRHLSSNKEKINSNLVGTSNEVEIFIGSVNTTALLDTGSSVSTISNSFNKKHFPNIDIHPIEDILRMECADGKELPYDGYIETELKIHGSKGSTNKDNTLNNCLLLVVPDSKYNSSVPILIGTNILSSLMDELHNSY